MENLKDKFNKIKKNGFVQLAGLMVAFGTFGDLLFNLKTNIDNFKEYKLIKQKIPRKIDNLQKDIKSKNYEIALQEIQEISKDFFYSQRNSETFYVNEDTKFISRPLENLLEESKDLSKPKSYFTHIKDGQFKEQLVDSLDKTKQNCLNYEGVVDGKIKYKPFLTGILGGAYLLSVGVTGIIYCAERRKRKLVKKK